MGVIIPQEVPERTGSLYPQPFAGQMAGRRILALGDAGGLTQFGANLVILEPGARSSLRHWHLHEDEFIVILEGTPTLVQDEGEIEMRAGDCAAFPAGDTNGHCFINRSSGEARFLVVGSRAPRETVTYSDVDMMAELQSGGRGGATFTHKDGRPYTRPDQGEPK